MLYNVMAWFGVIELLLVMYLTEHDVINKHDALWVKGIRSITFILVSVSLGYSTACVFERSFPVLLVLGGCEALLLINLIALYLRAGNVKHSFQTNRACN